MPDIDAVLYLDTDTLFISPVDDIWQFFYAFNSSQIAGITTIFYNYIFANHNLLRSLNKTFALKISFLGLSPEHEDKNVGWYNRFSKHPYYGALGVNSGNSIVAHIKV